MFSFIWYKSIEGAQFLKQKNAVNVIRSKKEPNYYFRKKDWNFTSAITFDTAIDDQRVFPTLRVSNVSWKLS